MPTSLFAAPSGTSTVAPRRAVSLFSQGTDQRAAKVAKDISKLEAAKAQAEEERGGEIKAPHPIISAAAAVGDVLSRINYAETGFLDEWARSDGNIGRGLKRAANEVLEGLAAFDDDDPALQAQKKTFGDLLEQTGIGDITVSDTLPFLFNETGSGWQLKKDGNPLDIGIRGTAGFFLDTVADPVTYLTLGTSKLLGSAGLRIVAALPGGKVATVLNKKGQQVLTQYTRDAMPWAVRKAMQMSANPTLVEDIDKRVFRAVHDSQLLADHLAREAAATRVTKAIAGGAKDLVDPGGIKFAGRTIVAGEKFKPLGDYARRFERAVGELPIGRQILEGGKAADRIIDNMFYSTLRGARNIPGYLEEKSWYRARRRALRASTEETIKEWTKGWQPDMKTLDGTMPAEEWFMRHLDNPDAYSVDNLPPVMRGVIDQVRGASDEMWGRELEWGFQQPSNYRKNYIPHHYLNSDEELERLSTTFRMMEPDFNALAPISGAGESRMFKTFDEGIAFAKAQGVDLKPDFDFKTVMAKRMESHNAAMAAQEFLLRVKENYGIHPDVVADQVFDHYLPQLRERLAKVMPLSPVHAATRDAGRLLAKPLGKVAPGAVRKLSSEGKAMYWLGRLRQVTDLKGLEKVLRHRKVLGKLDTALVDDLQKLMSQGMRNTVSEWNVPWGKVRVEMPDALGRAGGDYWLPEPILKDIKNTFVNTGRKLPKPLQQALDGVAAANTVFKGWMTAWPGFHVRNRYNNVIQSFLDIGVQAFNPARFARAHAILSGAEGTINTPFRDYTNKQMQELARIYGIVNERNFQLEGGGGLLPSRTRITEKSKWSPTQRSRDLGTAIENRDKMVLFMTHMERGLSPEQAAMRVNSFLFDYDDLSLAERKFFRNLIPFYTWNRKNTELQAKVLASSPGRQLAIQKAGERDTRQGPERDALPAYLRGDFKIKVDKAGGSWYVTGLDVPMNNALDLIFDGKVNTTLRRHISTLTPLVRTIGELATEQEWFTGRSLKERRALNGLEEVVKSMPPAVQRYLEFDKRIVGGEEQYTINGTKYYLLTQAWAISRLMGQLGRLKEDTSMGEFIANTLTGVSFEYLDADEKTRRALYNRRKELTDALSRAGVVSQFSVTDFEPAVTGPPPKKGSRRGSLFAPE